MTKKDILNWIDKEGFLKNIKEVISDIESMYYATTDAQKLLTIIKKPFR